MRHPPISFYAYTDFIPRKGELLILQDKKRVQVQDIYYWVGTVGKSKLTALMPVVYATLEKTGEANQG